MRTLLEKHLCALYNFHNQHQLITFIKNDINEETIKHKVLINHPDYAFLMSRIFKDRINIDKVINI